MYEAFHLYYLVDGKLVVLLVLTIILPFVNM